MSKAPDRRTSDLSYTDQTLVACSLPTLSSLASSTLSSFRRPASAVDGSTIVSFVDPRLPSDSEFKPKRGRGRPRKLPIIDIYPNLPCRKGQRTKTGCVTCRMRKKKCDEAKPTCVNCYKIGRDCEGYLNGEPKEKPIAGPDSKCDVPTEQECVVNRKEDGSKGEPHKKAQDFNDDDGEQGKGAATRTAAAETAASSDDDSATADHRNNDGHNVDLPPRYFTAARIDQQLQVNFHTHASKLFPPWQHKPNAFRNVMESLALKHKGVKCGLMCLSAQHLLQLNPRDRGLQERYRVHLDSAVRYSINLYQLCGHSCISPNPDSSDAYIALALIFCLTHEISGHDEFEGVMHRHYNTVVHMAVQCPQKSTNVPFQNLLEDMFLSRNSIALVTSIDRGYRNNDFRLPDFVQKDAVTLLGGARGLWVELSSINAIRQRMRERGGIFHPPDWPEDLQTQTMAQSLEHALLADTVEHVAGTLLHAAAMLYRASTLVYLYRTIMPSRPHAKISYRVNEGLYYLDLLMQKPTTQGVLLMPLFLLGCAAFEAEQRQKIRQAFYHLLRQPLNGNIQRSHAIVQALWQRMDLQSNESWDWEALGQRLGCTLITP